MRDTSKSNRSLVDQERVLEYAEHGFTLGDQLLTDDEADELFEIISSVVTDEHNPHHQRVHDFRHGGRPLLHIRNMWQRFEQFNRLHKNARLINALSDLTGAESFNLWQDRFFYKPAESGGFHTWHQDAAYLPFMHPYNQLTAWIALNDADEENGAMSMVPGSQNWGDASEFIEEIASYAGDDRPLPNNYGGRAVDVELCPVKKGCVHFHTGLTWHASGPNWSSRPRCGIALHYVVAPVRFDATHKFAKDYGGAHGNLLDPELYPLVAISHPAVA
ncbi:phytanoyl-CoA dioxygenase family protein [Bradyrhizobium prioriisuperbiae]|uniref:phytanoyl-CoA dioxygenase family protein n=1 Tax=Bradyrhizobium prioriisuperbiae TaxID=2854389 RepID=UPI0028E8A3D1|nr:phytanoyl-CoA dioxygenase family protein [Bradyrhizobium prioritasuperba]